MLNIDKLFGFHAQALKLREERSEVIANNLANVDTPGFKAKDLDFKEVMNKFQGKTMSMTGTHKNHFSMQNGLEPLTDYEFRRVQQGSIDGNTVNKDVETVAFAKNAFDYQASMSFLSGAIKTMRSAIKGE